MLIDGDLSGLTGSLTDERLTILPSSPFTEEIENIFFIYLFLPALTDFLELVIEIFELLTVTGDPALSFDEEICENLLFYDYPNFKEVFFVGAIDSRVVEFLDNSLFPFVR